MPEARHLADEARQYNHVKMMCDNDIMKIYTRSRELPVMRTTAIIVGSTSFVLEALIMAGEGRVENAHAGMTQC